MSKPASHPASQLDQEFQAAQRLVEILKQEQLHLIGADIDGLTALTDEKSKALAQLAELAQSRHQSLTAAGFSGSESGMQKWIEAPGHGAAAGKTWNELLAAMRAAKDMNRTNGVLINTHLGRTQAALNVLHANPQGAGLYGPDGQSSVRPVGRGLVLG
jgi:flagellar biosynthesis protein FlgN